MNEFGFDVLYNIARIACGSKSAEVLPKRTVSFSLPLWAGEYIEETAKKENRTASNWLATLILSLIEKKRIQSRDAARERTPGGI